MSGDCRLPILNDTVLRQVSSQRVRIEKAKVGRRWGQRKGCHWEQLGAGELAVGYAEGGCVHLELYKAFS